ncbi:hypothetical protein BaRGS_00029367 [Batillaria attramentaria]|uniref:Carbohydrate sulfotransferase n=1 Tax=Batillaria attramentaria TaxID=370345 RepID=A0ABD0JWA5_9CAEN
MNPIAALRRLLFRYGLYQLHGLFLVGICVLTVPSVFLLVVLNRSEELSLFRPKGPMWVSQHGQGSGRVTPVERFRQRRQHFVDTCRMIGHAGEEDDGLSPLMRFENLTVCLPSKAGSTLFKMILHYLAENKASLPNEQPFFQVQFGNVHEELPKSLRAPRRGKLDGGGMKTAVFVRDPYTRLLFAYIDKLFRPRLDYWRTYGKPILTHVRGHEETDLSRMCASDVTFAEFIRYLVMSELEKKTKVSPHFYPISRQCGLCNEPENLSVVYDFIGKTETYATDAPAILKAVGLYDRLPHDFDLGVAYRQRNMELLVNYTFRRHLSEPLSTMCTSKAETLVRVWRILQIRGIFSTSESFPFSNTSAEDVTYGQFLQTSRAAFKRSLEDRSLSGNVNTAMKEAYSTVPLADRKALQRIFHRDFLLFQYPSSVPGVFPENDRFQLDRFHFFDVFHERFKEKTAEL